jgi:hypothetical protein
MLIRALDKSEYPKVNKKGPLFLIECENCHEEVIRGRLYGKILPLYCSIACRQSGLKTRSRKLNERVKMIIQDYQDGGKKLDKRIGYFAKYKFEKL